MHHPDLIGNNVVDQDSVNGEKGDKDLRNVFKYVRIMRSLLIAQPDDLFYSYLYFCVDHLNLTARITGKYSYAMC